MHAKSLDRLFLSIGLKAANSEYPCIWCKCNKNDFGDMTKKWSTTDINYGARKLEEAKYYSKNNNSKFGYRDMPLTNIEFDHCVIDLLHLLLRISDVLLNLFLYNLFEADEMDSSDLSKRKNLSAFLNFLENSCKIQNPYFVCQTSKKIKLRSFNGNEIINILEKTSICLPQIFPLIPNIYNISGLWLEFISIYKQLKENYLELIDNLEERLFHWLALFKCTYISKHITPYIHAFVFHLPEFYKLHGDINLFNQQGLEKLNDLSTLSFHRGSNKDETYLKQLINKRNRQELYFLGKY